MKITLKELKSLVNEAVKKKLQESPAGDIGRRGTNWAEMKYQFARGHLEGSWRLIMTAMEETSGDRQRALQLLKASVAKLEAQLQHEPKPPEEEMASTEELTDFGKLL